LLLEPFVESHECGGLAVGVKPEDWVGKNAAGQKWERQAVFGFAIAVFVQQIDSQRLSVESPQLRKSSYVILTPRQTVSQAGTA
jgi:hypothetical protein